MAMIAGLGPRMGSMRAPDESLSEKLGRPAPTLDDDHGAAAVSRFVQNSDEMAAALRSQFRRRADVSDKLEGPGEHFERVLEDEVLPRANAIQSLAGHAQRSLPWLLAQARQYIADDSDLVLVLRELLQRKQMPTVTRQRLAALLELLLAQAPPKRLQAGINCALKARLFGRKLALRAGMLRETYRSFLESESDPATHYEDWIALYGHERRSAVLDFIEAALLTDIDALDPSCSRREFGGLLARLGQLKSLRSSEYLFVQHLLGDILVARHNPAETDWLLFLLGLLRWPDELCQLLDAVLGHRLLDVSHADRGALLHRIRLACNRLPLALFGDDQAHARVASLFDDLSDIAYAREAIERHATQLRATTSLCNQG